MKTNKSGEELFDWFIRRRETLALKMTIEHLAKVEDTTVELYEAIMTASKGKTIEFEQAIGRLSKNEVEADKLRRAIADALTKGDIPPKEREDLMHLVRRNDLIADLAKDAATNLKIVIASKVDISEEVLKMFVKISEKLVECVRALKLGVEGLTKDPAEALKYAAEVERIEHNIDEDYFKTKEMFINYSIRISPLVLVILRDVLHCMERAADNCEDAADIIHTVAIRSR